MSVLAFFSAVRTVPKPSILSTFNGLEEELADDGTGGQKSVLLSVLFVDDLLELVLVPIVHVILFLVISSIGEHITLFSFPVTMTKSNDMIFVTCYEMEDGNIP